jgi:sialate O-acetylesterase
MNKNSLWFIIIVGLCYWSCKDSESLIPETPDAPTVTISLGFPPDNASYDLSKEQGVLFAWREVSGLTDYKVVVSLSENLSPCATFLASGDRMEVSSAVLTDSITRLSDYDYNDYQMVYWSVLPFDANVKAQPQVRTMTVRKIPGALKLAGIFTNNVVLQRQTNAPVWGIETPNATLTITPEWSGQAYTTNADNYGKWKILLPTPVAGGPYTLTVKGSGCIKLKNVMIGEVWLASGQSNMDMRLRGGGTVEHSAEAIANAGGKQIYFVNIPQVMADTPTDVINDVQWIAASEITAGDCSAVGWFFADALQEYLHVPIGIINASVGSTAIETWSPLPSCHQGGGNAKHRVPLMYNGMIYPLKEFAIKGALWYQGESNINTDADDYNTYLKELVSEWRCVWNEGDFPFYYVQIAPFDYWGDQWWKPTAPDMSAYMRETQMKAQKEIPNSGIAVLLDAGERNQIHPKYKKQVGDRLAGLTLAKEYGKTGFEPESPEYERMEISENTLTLYFTKSLAAPNNLPALTALFEVAGTDKIFYPATQVLVNGHSIAISSSSVLHPVAIRYAFKDFVIGELFGTGGLPVSSFRTDN